MTFGIKRCALEQTNISATLGKLVSETRHARVEPGPLAGGLCILPCGYVFCPAPSTRVHGLAMTPCLILQVNALLCCQLCLLQLMHCSLSCWVAMPVLPPETQAVIPASSEKYRTEGPGSRVGNGLPWACYQPATGQCPKGACAAKGTSTLGRAVIPNLALIDRWTLLG